MRTPLLLAAALFAALPLRAAQPDPSAPEALAGAWTVDLSTDPAQPYTRPMQLELLPDGRVQGSFYESTIQAGRWKRDRGRVCASFRTTDGKGPYHTAVCLQGTRAVGQTWAEHRDFLFNWDATRAAAPR